jgi:hypothetical protein
LNAGIDGERYRECQKLRHFFAGFACGLPHSVGARLLQTQPAEPPVWRDFDLKQPDVGAGRSYLEGGQEAPDLTLELHGVGAGGGRSVFEAHGLRDLGSRRTHEAHG